MDLILSHDGASESVIMLCIKNDNQWIRYANYLDGVNEQIKVFKEKFYMKEIADIHIHVYILVFCHVSFKAFLDLSLRVR